MIKSPAYNSVWKISFSFIFLPVQKLEIKCKTFQISTS